MILKISKLDNETQPCEKAFKEGKDWFIKFQNEDDLFVFLKNNFNASVHHGYRGQAPFIRIKETNLE